MLDNERCILVQPLHPVHAGDRRATTRWASSTRGGHSAIADRLSGPRLRQQLHAEHGGSSARWGALTSKDFRFQMRVWFLKETKSLCTSCGAGLQHRDRFSREAEDLSAMTPRSNDASELGRGCAITGRLELSLDQSREDSLTPGVFVAARDGRSKSSGALGTQPFNAVADRISSQAASRESVAVVASARQTNEELYLIKRVGAGKLGAAPIGRRSAHWAEARSDSWWMHGSRTPTAIGARGNLACRGGPMGSRHPFEGHRGGDPAQVQDQDVASVTAKMLTRLWDQQGVVGGSSTGLMVSRYPAQRHGQSLAHWVLPGLRARGESAAPSPTPRAGCRSSSRRLTPPWRREAGGWSFLRESADEIGCDRCGEEPESVEAIFDRLAAENPGRSRGLSVGRRSAILGLAGAAGPKRRCRTRRQIGAGGR